MEEQASSADTSCRMQSEAVGHLGVQRFNWGLQLEDKVPQFHLESTHRLAIQLTQKHNPIAAQQNNILPFDKFWISSLSFRIRPKRDFQN